MKTAFRNLMMTFAVMAGLTAGNEAEAGTILTNKASFVEDTFALGTPVPVKPFNSTLQALEDATQTRTASGATLTTASGTTSLSTNLIGTIPELREVDRDHYFWQANKVPQTWMGNTDLVVTPKSGNPLDGEVKILAGSATAAANNRALAWVPLFIKPDGSPYSDKPDWTIQADVDVSNGGVAGIGWFDNIANYTGEQVKFESGLGQFWGRVEIKYDDVVNKTGMYAQICWMSGSKVLFRDTPRPGDADNYFNFELNGYNTIFMQYNGETQEAEMKVNNQTILAFTAISQLASQPGVGTLDFDPSADFRATPNFFGVGFQLRGGAKLDNFAATPEPSSMVMMCFGMLFFGMQNRRNRRRGQKLGLTTNVVS